jgi:hypothetical protein
MLGADDSRRIKLRNELGKRLIELGLSVAAVRFIDESVFPTRDRKAPQMALFFGGTSHTDDLPQIVELIEDSITIAPLVSSVAQVHTEVPSQLRHVNALEIGNSGSGIERLVNLVLETFRLLRRERKLFISYRRADSQPFVERVYDALDARGFNVFLDMRSVPPAVDFQSELWHRMADSDVVVLIDTPGFRASRWTTAELARANATNVQILHILWPRQKEDGASSFSHFMELKNEDFLGNIPAKGHRVKKATLARICSQAESLRARAMAARHCYLVDNFCDAARDQGKKPQVQLERWISITRADGRVLAVIPAVGVPTSDRINAMFDAITGTVTDSYGVWIIYDDRGILSTWIQHLDWLDHHLPVRTIKMSNAAIALKGLGK